MDPRRINLIKAIFIIVIAVVTYVMLDRILLLKSEDGIEQIKAMYQQEEDSIDVLFVGTSHTYCHANTGLLWSEFGISAYNLGGAEQPYWNTYYYIKEALKTQRPDLIAFEFTGPGTIQTQYQNENWFVTNNYGLKRNANRYESMKVSSAASDFPKRLIPLNIIHGRYADLTADDFIDKDNTINFKGFDPRETLVRFDTPQLGATNERAPLLEKEEVWLRRLIEYVQSEEIPLLLFCSPYYITPEDQALYNTVYDIAAEYEVPCVDFNLFYNEMNLDFATDMAEELHLNRVGNAKFSLFLGAFLQNVYDIADHREEGTSKDSIYYSWNREALYQQQSNASWYIRNVYHPDKYFTLFLDDTVPEINEYMTNYDPSKDDEINDDPVYEDGLIRYFMPKKENYIVFVQIAPETTSISEELLEKLSAIGISDPVPGGAYALCDGEVLFFDDTNSFSYTYYDQKNRITLSRVPSDDSGKMKAVYSPEYRTSVRILGDVIPLDKEEVAITVYDKVLHKLVDNLVIGTDPDSYYIRHNEIEPDEIE
ncbi:MAG: hypothetical protein IJT16_03910 [Lachnospiraceae bacterium]|nr:hypothetical protein [Lachnospiraceae bacterium]